MDNINPIVFLKNNLENFSFSFNIVNIELKITVYSLS